MVEEERFRKNTLNFCDVKMVALVVALLVLTEIPVVTLSRKCMVAMTISSLFSRSVGGFATIINQVVGGSCASRLPRSVQANTQLHSV